MALHGIRAFAALALGSLALSQAPAARAASHETVTLASTSKGAPQDVPAELYRPDGDGPFPAIVVLHDCSGLGPRSSGSPGRWAEKLLAEGYVVLLPDSFAPRGYPAGVCTLPVNLSTDTIDPLARSYDAFAALAFLRRQPYVDGAHIGVMGGSHGGTTILLIDATPVGPAAPLAEERRHGFAAAIALYPGCAGQYGAWNAMRAGIGRGPVLDYVGTYQPVAPLLILVGEKDDWTPAAHCEALAQRAQAAGYAVTLKVYPGAQHSFDSDAPPRFIDARRNVNSPTGHGATTGGDPAAWADSVAQAKAFFARYLKDEAAPP